MQITFVESCAFASIWANEVPEGWTVYEALANQGIRPELCTIVQGIYILTRDVPVSGEPIIIIPKTEVLLENALGKLKS